MIGSQIVFLILIFQLISPQANHSSMSLFILLLPRFYLAESFSFLKMHIKSNLFTMFSVSSLPRIVTFYIPSIKVFSNGSALCIKRPRYWTLNFSITPSDKYSEFDLLAIQGSLKSLLQDNSSKSSIQCSDFFIVQLLHLYMTTRKTIALTVWTFVGKVMPLLINMLSRFVIAFLPRSKHLLILWLQSLSAVILELKKIKSVTISIVSPSICHEVMEPDALIFIF